MTDRHGEARVSDLRHWMKLKKKDTKSRPDGLLEEPNKNVTRKYIKSSIKNTLTMREIGSRNRSSLRSMTVNLDGKLVNTDEIDRLIVEILLTVIVPLHSIYDAYNYRR